jgi:hypothetical protein
MSTTTAKTMIATALLLAAVALNGCKTTGPMQPAGVNAPPPRSDLVERVKTLWKARLQEDWTTVYQFEEPDTRAELTQEKFVNWSRENEPFVVKEYDIRSVTTDGEMGWAEVRYTAGMRKFPQLPPREATKYEPWRVTDGQWYPVPRQALKLYPEAPSRRNAAEEKALRQRFEEAWAAEYAEDWEALWQLMDPNDRVGRTAEEFKNYRSATIRSDHEVVWVEVVGNRGRVRVRYNAKLNDPNLSKAAPQVRDEIETWVPRDGVWYRDLEANQ